jgi:hypothetical protein
VAVVKTLENQTITAVRNRHAAEARDVVGMLEHNEKVAPGVHLDSSIRRSLGLKVDEAKALSAPELSEGEEEHSLAKLPAPAISKVLAEAKTAGPIARDAFAGAAAVSTAAQRVKVQRKKTEAIRESDELDATKLF